MNTQTLALAVTMLATTLIAGTILGASATYPFGANPVLMKIQAQEMVEPVPDVTQGGPAGVEVPQDEMVAPLPEGGLGAPVAPGKEVPQPIEEPAPLPVEEVPVQTAAPVEECPSPEEVAIIEETNKTGTEVINTVEEQVMNVEVVENVTEIVENITETVEETVNGTADPVNVTETVDEVVEVVEETPEIPQQTGTGLLALLEKLVESQDFNENLTDNERAGLDAELGVAKQELSAAFTENVI